MSKRLITAAMALGLLGAFVAFTRANSYEGTRYATTEGKVYQHLSGEFSLAASSSTSSTYTITLDGDGGLITASSVTLTGRMTANSVSATTYLNLPITSTAAISASITALQAVDALHTSSITALMLSTTNIQSELDAFQAQVAVDTTTLSAGAFLASTQTFTGGNTFAGAAAFSSAVSTVTFSGWVDIGLVTVSSGPISATSNTVDCAAGYKALSCGCFLSSTYIYKLYTSDADTCYCAPSSGAVDITVYAICARVK